MKKIFLIPVLLVAVFISCKKEDSAVVPLNATLSASESGTIKQGEPLHLTYKSSGTDTSITWEVSPAGNAIINKSGRSAVIVFTRKGSYSITGRTTHTSARLTVNVSDSIYTAGGNSGAGGSTATTYTTVSLAGDQLKITPSIGDSLFRLFLTGLTANKYSCLNNNLLFTRSQSGNSYAFDYTGVSIPDGNACTGESIAANSFAMLEGNADGTYNLSIKFNGIVYSGSYVKSGNSYSFNWPYTSGVVITPLYISR